MGRRHLVSWSSQSTRNRLWMRACPCRWGNCTDIGGHPGMGCSCRYGRTSSQWVRRSHSAQRGGSGRWLPAARGSPWAAFAWRGRDLMREGLSLWKLLIAHYILHCTHCVLHIRCTCISFRCNFLMLIFILFRFHFLPSVAVLTIVITLRHRAQEFITRFTKENAFESAYIAVSSQRQRRVNWNKHNASCWDKHNTYDARNKTDA